MDGFLPGSCVGSTPTPSPPKVFLLFLDVMVPSRVAVVVLVICSSSSYECNAPSCPQMWRVDVSVVMAAPRPAMFYFAPPLRDQSPVTLLLACRMGFAGSLDAPPVAGLCDAPCLTTGTCCAAGEDGGQTLPPTACALHTV